MLAEEHLEFKSREGEVLGILRLVAERANSPFLRLTPSEATDHSEEPLQLVEGEVYQYELDRSGVQLEENIVVKRFLVGAATLDRGTISTGLNTGLLNLHLLKNGERVGAASVEIRSSKLSYREEYRLMLERIAEASIDLLLHLPAPTEARLEMDETTTVDSLQQQFFFIRGLLSGEQFEVAIAQVIRQPHTRLVPIRESRNLTERARSSGALARQLSSASRRMVPGNDHPLAKRMARQGIQNFSLPYDLEADEFVETLDTPENRFIKKALSDFRDAVEHIYSRLHFSSMSSMKMAEREVKPLLLSLESILSNDLFTQLSNPTEVPIGSPVLQRKAGYREILKTWLRFESSGRLTWDGGDDVFGAGKRDIATLYEYWLFFVLWDVVAKRIDGDSAALLRENVIEATSNGLGLKLKTGKFLPITGVEITHSGKKFRMQFSYNRTYSAAPFTRFSEALSYKSNAPVEGSWTMPMRPDYSISFWSASKSAEEAEEDGSIIHIHFDAKYSVKFTDQLFGKSDFDLDQEKLCQRSGTYRRADLLKMHAYKDAIRRSRGAYILYPGAEGKQQEGGVAWSEFHEVLPGLGAFVIKPTNELAGKVVLGAFLSDILDQATTKIT